MNIFLQGPPDEFDMEKLKKIGRELVPDVVEDLTRENIRKMLKDSELLLNVKADSKKTLGLSTKDLRNPANKELLKKETNSTIEQMAYEEALKELKEKPRIIEGMAIQDYIGKVTLYFKTSSLDGS